MHVLCVPLSRSPARSLARVTEAREDWFTLHRLRAPQSDRPKRAGSIRAWDCQDIIGHYICLISRSNGRYPHPKCILSYAVAYHHVVSNAAALPMLIRVPCSADDAGLANARSREPPYANL